MRIRRLVVGGAIGLVAVACTGGSDGVTPGTTPASETTAPTETVSPPYVLDLSTGEQTPLPESLAGGSLYVPSPDGTRVAYDTCGDGSCPSTGTITVANLDGTDVRTIEAPGISSWPWWSPDGTTLLYQVTNGAFHAMGNLFLHDLRTDRRTQITDFELTSAEWSQLAMNFSPDGRSVIYHLPRTSAQLTQWDVWSVPVTGGEPTLVLRDAAFPRYFPDGERIAFVVPTTSGFQGRIIAVAETDGPRRTLVEATQPTYWWPSVSPDGTQLAYHLDGAIHVMDVSTGESVKVGPGGRTPEWLDDDTLIVSPE